MHALKQVICLSEMYYRNDIERCSGMEGDSTSTVLAFFIHPCSEVRRRRWQHVNGIPFHSYELVQPR